MRGLRAELQHLRRDPGWGSHGVGAGHHEPGVHGRCIEKLSEEAGYSRTGTPSKARSCNSPNWESSVQVGSSESPPPAHSQARGGGGVRGTPALWGAERSARAGEQRPHARLFPARDLFATPFCYRMRGEPSLAGADGCVGWGLGGGSAESLCCPSVAPISPRLRLHFQSWSLKPDHFPRYWAVSRVAQGREER